MCVIVDELIDRLIPVYADLYYMYPDGSDERFSQVRGFVCPYILKSLYIKLVNQKEILPFCELPKEKKDNYLRIANKYQDNPDYIIGSAKAAYVLELITSTF